MLKYPKRTLYAVNDRVTVSLPMTTIDAEAIAGKIKVEQLKDVDTMSEGKRDGSVLVYDQNTETWRSTIFLKKQVMDAGEY